MLSVIARIIRSTLGIVLNNVGNTAADKLKERPDVTDEKLGDVIIQDLNDIKTKIDGLPRKKLLASYSFLKEGVISLNVALDEAKDKPINEDEANADQDGGSKTTETTTRKESESEVLNEAVQLSTAIQKLNNTSSGQLVAAKKCFKAAHEEATRTFCNEALSLPERIMATKLRVVSKILECLHNTKEAVVGCMLFLEELHNLPTIGETFSTYLKGGIKSKVYKDSRLENVKSVLSLNFAVSGLIATFSSELPNVRNWPRIHLPTKCETIHPLIIHADVVKDIFDKEEFQPPENHVISKEIRWIDHCVINSKGDLLFADKNAINIISRSGKRKTFCELPQTAANHSYVGATLKALAIDRYDNVVIIINFTGGIRDVCVLFVFDCSGNKKCECLLGFVEISKSRETINCLVNNDGEFLVNVHGSNNIYVCDSLGTLKSLLPLEENSSYHLGDCISLECVTDQNELIMCTNENVLVYTREGKLKRTIKSGRFHRNVTYNHQTSKIEILVEKNSRFGTTNSFSIFSYSENDDVERLYVPVKDWMIYPKIIHHPAGPGAINIYQNYKVHDSSIVFM